MMQTQLVKKTAIIDSGDFNLSAARYLEKVEINSSFDLIKMSDLDIQYFKGINVKNKNPENGKFRLIPSGANFPDKLIKNKCKYFDDINDKALEKKLILNDILFNTGGQGTLGRVGIYNDDSFDSFTDGFILTIRNKDNKLNSKYLFWLLQSNAIKNEIIKFTRGATGITSIKNDDILNFELPLPPLEIQEQIVKEIEGYQQIIDGCRQVVENYKPVINIDPSWKMIDLGKACNIKSGGTPSRKEKEYWYGDINWYSSGELNGLFTKPAKEKISLKGLKNSNCQIFPTGSLLVGMYDTAAFKMSILSQDSAFNQAICGIEINEKINLKFLYIFFQTNKDIYLNKRVGARQRNLSKKFFSELKIPFIDIKIQNKIAEKIEQEIKLIENNKELIKIYENKINARINKVWSDN